MKLTVKGTEPAHGSDGETMETTGTGVVVVIGILLVDSSGPGTSIVGSTSAHCLTATQSIAIDDPEFATLIFTLVSLPE